MESHWTPSPELLAAYADGEFEGRDELAGLCRRLEDWLQQHPEAREELATYRRLRQAWHATTPADPGQAAWDDSWSGILQGCRRGASAPPSLWADKVFLVLGLCLAACLVVAAAWWLPADQQAPGRPGPVAEMVDPDDGPFLVAAESEVVILRVEGEDTPTLVVGELPLGGPLVLAEAGDVTVTSVQPDQRDNMVPQFVSGPGRPMIWARLESD